MDGKGIIYWTELIVMIVMADPRCNWSGYGAEVAIQPETDRVRVCRWGRVVDSLEPWTIAG